MLLKGYIGCALFLLSACASTRSDIKANYIDRVYVVNIDQPEMSYFFDKFSEKKMQFSDSFLQIKNFDSDSLFSLNIFFAAQCEDKKQLNAHHNTVKVLPINANFKSKKFEVYINKNGMHKGATSTYKVGLIPSITWLRGKGNGSIEGSANFSPVNFKHYYLLIPTYNEMITIRCIE